LELIKRFITFAKIILNKMGQDKGNVRINGNVQVAGRDGLPVSFTPSRAFAVSPSDTTVLMPGILFVGTGGDLVVVPANQTEEVMFTNIPDGTWFPVLVKKVMAATGAGDILICY
jgi:hypothetical protein